MYLDSQLGELPLVRDEDEVDVVEHGLLLDGHEAAHGLLEGAVVLAPPVVQHSHELQPLQQGVENP